MADNNDTQNASTQANTGPIQAVRQGSEPERLNEGYQPLERKGHQPTTRPAHPSPPQSVSADIPFTAPPATDSSTTPPAAPVTPSQPQTDAQK